MKRFSYLCRLTLTLMALAFASIASAELQRSPEPGPLPLTPTELADRNAAQNFMSFYNSMRSANPKALEAATAYPQGNLRQRPEKIMRTAWDPSKELYIVVPNFNGLNSYSDAYYGKLDVETSTISRIYRNAVFTNAEEAYLQTGVVRDGIIYIPKMLADMVTHDATIIWNRFDIFTGQVLEPINFGSNANAFKMFCYSLTYDPVNDVIYGLTYDNNTGLGGGLIRIDCSRPEDQWVAESFYDSNNNPFNVGGTASDWMAGICFDPLSQTLYGLTSQGTFCEIDTNRCQRITLREYDYSDEDFCFPPVMQSTPMAYSPYDKAIIFISFNNNIGTSAIGSIDAAEESWDAYYLNDFSDQLMASTLYCPDPFADDNAPGVMECPVLSFNPGSVNGSISATAPLTYYNGLALDSSVKMTLHILANGKEIFSQQVTPGEEIKFDTTLDQGLNSIIAYCTLGDLKGAESKTRLYIGYDQPLPPTDLSYIGGILSWKAPAPQGVHNAFIDLSDSNYDVYVDGVKHNTDPIKGTSYELSFNEPADGRKNITVTITSNGVTSTHSEAVSRVLGQGYPLPVTITPTQAEATLFDTLNLNNGASNWHWEKSGAVSYSHQTLPTT
ncbi:MAG: hypothetical protein K2J15_01890 [Muribaculaceae bacterium]|nr:hypothetical protein [Muribaculaceae bacterium]